MKNQLDELKTKCMIIETTKQDELDEIRFKSQQEIDSLNHIISNKKRLCEFLYNLKVFKTCKI